MINVYPEAKGLCKRCYSQTPEAKAYYKKHSQTPERIISQKIYSQSPQRKASLKAYSQSHQRKEYYKKYNKKYHKLPEVKEKSKKYRSTPEFKAWRKLYRQSPEIKEKEKNYSKSPERKAKMKEYYQSERGRSNAEKRRKERTKLDVCFRASRNISSLMRINLRKHLSSKNSTSAWSCLPYTPQQLIEHLEKQFEPWMNWSNWGVGKGKWNIDHIRPDCSFKYATASLEDDEFQKSWALSNLRPLDAIENLSKGSKIIN